jgi:hypothetical protein
MSEGLPRLLPILVVVAAAVGIWLGIVAFEAIGG